ncbi:MAG: DUF4139 domain-containing protein [Labilithrix sp.]|nr:DUF4139 domain-containing protein [Labilithrix sp.]MCW5814070.1 DUF4139 domain-containing protein [Labilithrix sp.]
MRTFLVAAAAFALAGCGTAAMPRNTAPSAAAKTPPSPGRVVVYRNGVAYVERFADVEGETMTLAVPREKVDDLLKSLTVSDLATGEPVPVSYVPNGDEGGLMALKIGGKPTPTKRRLRLTYVTGAPAWKPSYRVVVGKTGEVELQAWAIVDNASGEDWKDVRLGVGASSAMSFRFDLRGLKVVEREALSYNDQFAQQRAVAKAAAHAPAAAAAALEHDDGALSGPPSTEPIGTSHFESDAPMTVPKGTSAMVAILKAATEGEVVYLYDPTNPRGDARFPYRTIRFRNPSDGALESGPVSVFGDGRFVGEGLADPVPAKSIAFVPFALDRQIAVDQTTSERDEITRIAGVSHGVFKTDIKHTRKKTFAFTNRMGERATVYLKYAVTPGYKLAKFPDTRSPAPGASDSSDHLADASLFKVDLEPNGSAEVEIEEATAFPRNTDIRAAGALELVRAYLAKSDDALKTRVEHLKDLGLTMAKTEDQITVTQHSIREEQTRIEELKNQLATLKAVKSGGALAQTLEKKLAELTAKNSARTVEVVALQEKLMVAQVELQAAVADLTFDGDTKKVASAP